MAKVTGFTAARMLEIERSSIVSAAMEGEDELIFYTRGGDRIRAGVIRGGTAEWIRETQPIIQSHEEILSETNNRLEEITDTLNEAEEQIGSIPGIKIDVLEALGFAQNALETAQAAGAVLRIDSSKGTVFKHSEVSTVLTVTIFKGEHTITNLSQLWGLFGNTAYLEWSWRKKDAEHFGIISSADDRISDGGFSFTVSPNDVDEKTVFMCTVQV